MRDNVALLALDAACRMGAGRWSAWTIRHDPDFFALFRVAGVRAHVGAAMDGAERVIATVTIVEQPIVGDQGIDTALYVSGWQVHPAYRGRGVGDALARWAIDRCLTIGGPTSVGWFVAAGSGARLRSRLARLDPSLAMSRPSALRLYCLRTFHWRSAMRFGRLVVRPARPDDVVEMAALWDSAALARRLAPRLDVAVLERWRSHVMTDAPACYWVVRDASGTLRGFMGLWDQRAVKHLHLERPLPWPRAGPRFPCLVATHPCVPLDAPDVARALLSTASRAACRAGVRRILVMADAADSLATVCREWSARSQPYTATAVSRCATGLFAETDRRPVHMETGIA